MTSNPLPNRNREVARAGGFTITSIMPGTGNYIARRSARRRRIIKTCLGAFVVAFLFAGWLYCSNETANSLGVTNTQGASR
jgi:hypothetical protein